MESSATLTNAILEELGDLPLMKPEEGELEENEKVGRVGHQEKNSCLRNFDANGIKEIGEGRQRVKVLFLLRYNKLKCPGLACLS